MQEQTLSQEEQQSINTMNRIQKDYERELDKYNRFSERYKRESCKYSFYVWKSRINKEFKPDKEQKLAISNYAYQIGMVGENMNNLILKLDNIDTYGNENIRQTRKELIKTIQKSIDTNDKLYKQAKRLNQLYIDHFFPPEVDNSKMEEERNKNENEKSPSTESESESESEEEIKEEVEDNNENKYQNIPDAPSLNSSLEMEQEDNNNKKSRRRKHHHNRQSEQQEQEQYNEPLLPQFVESSRHINRKWTPRYKLNRYGRDLALRVELPYVKEENIEISLDPDNDTINISGMRNLENMYSRFNAMKDFNTPNYDYFELEVPIELNKIDTENIRYEFEDFILTIIFPSKRIIYNNRNDNRYINSWFNNDYYPRNPFFAF